MQLANKPTLLVIKLALGASLAACTSVPVEPLDSSIDRASIPDASAQDASSTMDAAADQQSPDADAPDAMTAMCAANEQRCSGVCINVQTDDLNCGMCDRACPASDSCVAGRCEPMMTCTAPQTNCGGGCVNTMTDTAHCGMCGNRCMAGQRCANGACAASRCPVGQSDCTPTAPTATCVDVRSDAMNCGVCGTACAAGETCASGVCQPMACTAGTRCVVGGVASCRNLQIDRAHCGACNNACAASELCVMGRCQSSCAAPRTSCPVGASRVCVDTQTDEQHCGACGTACPAGQTCNAGRCGCAAGRTSCPSGCADLQTDEANCGACGTSCPSGQSCNAGRCACPTGFTLCNGTCVDTQSNTANCGRCSNACAAPSTCSAGVCNTMCPPATTFCGGSCILVSTYQNDERNCGACGRVCPGASQCHSGVCGPANDVRTAAQELALNIAREMNTPGTTVGASHDGPSVPCSCTSGPNVWYRFRIAIAGVVYFDTAGASFDTSLFLTDNLGMPVPAQSVNGFSNLGLCNDDSRCGMGGGFTNENQARLAGYLTPGTYYLAVGGCGTGTFTLHSQFVSEIAGRNFVNNRLRDTGTAPTATLGSESSLYSATCGGTTGAEYVRWYLSCGETSERQLFSVCRSDGTAGFQRVNALTGAVHDPVLYARSAQTGATLSCVDNSSASATVDCRGTIDFPAPLGDQLDSSHYGARLSNLNTPRGIGTVYVDTKFGGAGMTFSLYSEVN